MNAEDQFQSYYSNSKAFNMSHRSASISSKYRVKRPFSMISNSNDLNSEVINSHSQRKMKYHSNNMEGHNSHNTINSFNNYNTYSVECKKSSPVFSVKMPSQYFPQDVEMPMITNSNNYSQINDSKRLYIDKLKNEMSNYKSQMGKSDQKYMYNYECCGKY